MIFSFQQYFHLILSNVLLLIFGFKFTSQEKKASKKMTLTQFFFSSIKPIKLHLFGMLCIKGEKIGKHKIFEKNNSYDSKKRRQQQKKH